LGDGWIEPAPILGDARIMDDDCATTSRDEPRIGAAEAASRSGYDDRSIVEADRG
jgi:hypothetical protein